MSDLLPVSTHEMLACVERELALRHRNYPRWVSTKRMTQQLADREIRAMQAVLDHLRSCPWEHSP